MNKSHFIDFIENPSKIREKDADILAELLKNYPYSSLIHTLLAKAQAGTPQAKSSLASAALHIPDRSVLKEIMENKFSRASLVGKESTPDTRPGSSAEESKINRVAISRKQVEESHFSSLSAVNNEEASPALEEETTSSLNTENADTEEGGVKEIPVQPLPERLQEIVQNREVQEIKDPKRVEQINLIDSFIEKSGSIARKYRSLNEEESPQSDLTDGYQFTPQDLVTENLAKIMVRQGKTEKAIDIYEKLVLKYPQKKTYFATCIDKLKNTQ